jgi:hypothetical protein
MTDYPPDSLLVIPEEFQQQLMASSKFQGQGPLSTEGSFPSQPTFDDLLLIWFLTEAGRDLGNEEA